METSTLNLNSSELAGVSRIGEADRVAQPLLRQPEQSPASCDQDQVVTLRPRPLLWLRKTLVCAGSAYLLISPLSPSFKLDCCLLGLVILGTYRTTTASASRISWHYRFGFLPFYSRQLLLKDQITIQTGWEERSGLGEALLLGLWSTCLAPLADWLCPWPGGSYRLWVQSAQGQRVLVWRGRVEKTFYRNHKLLSQATGLPSQRGPSL